MESYSWLGPRGTGFDLVTFPPFLYRLLKPLFCSFIMSVFFPCHVFSFFCNWQLLRVLGCVLTHTIIQPQQPPRLLAAQHVVCFYLSLLTPLSDEEIIHYHASIDLLHLLPLWQRPPPTTTTTKPPPRHFRSPFKTPPRQIWKCSTATKGPTHKRSKRRI